MTTKEFIEKAIEGGWEHYSDVITYDEKENQIVTLTSPPDNIVTKVRIEVFILNPLVWEAVAKVEGWDEPLESEYDIYMHQMIDHLIEGGTIESYLETL
tara:strand:- start:92 stop:388 length:297 start_codon:yes stop_codon:yes gene_type:complete